MKKSIYLTMKSLSMVNWPFLILYDQLFAEKSLRLNISKKTTKNLDRYDAVITNCTNGLFFFTYRVGPMTEAMIRGRPADFAKQPQRTLAVLERFTATSDLFK